MLPEWLLNLFRDNAGLLGVIIVVCLAYKERREASKVLEGIAERCHESQDKASDAIKGNALAIGANTAVLEEVKKYLIRLNGHAPVS